jgi:argininosuccinate lyase
LIAATDLADHLTQRGLPFRQAHEIVGRIVRAAEAGQRRLDSFTLSELQAFSPLFEGPAVGLQAAQVVAARDVVGGTAPSQVAAQLAFARERLGATREWIDEHIQALPTLESVTAD